MSKTICTIMSKTIYLIELSFGYTYLSLLAKNVPPSFRFERHLILGPFHPMISSVLPVMSSGSPSSALVEGTKPQSWG
jgi:hypothetical protein